MIRCVSDWGNSSLEPLAKGARPVTAELALLFGRAFDQTPQYWLNLQAAYDLKTAEASLCKLLDDVHSLAHA